MTSWMTPEELRRQKKYGRTLRQVAKYINERHGVFLRADVMRWTSNTDRKIPGTRLRHPGKGRTGSRIRVLVGEFLLVDHKNSETYRRVSEVHDWLARWEAGERIDQSGHDSRHWRKAF